MGEAIDLPIGQQNFHETSTDGYPLWSVSGGIQQKARLPLARKNIKGKDGIIIMIIKYIHYI